MTVFWTACATTKDVVGKPAAIIHAASKEEAETVLRRMRKVGELLYLPMGTYLTVRRSSRSEVATYLAFLCRRAEGSLPSIDARATRRSWDKSLIFCQKLWRGEIRFDDD